MSDFSQKLNGEITILTLAVRELLARLPEDERKNIKWRIDDKLLNASRNKPPNDFIEGAHATVENIFNPADQESGT